MFFSSTLQPKIFGVINRFSAIVDKFHLVPNQASERFA
jgi:hypothetical protein